ncbi:uncharacterized protein BO72DRAFT_347232, partial [Aspergillus fijiensis CBS 313.89]
PQDSEQEDDDGSLRPMSYTFSLSKNYVRDWSNQDAFRELYQNWKDGILASFHLNQRDFRPEIQQKRTVIRICLYHPHNMQDGTRELLGYIIWRERYGGIELANFDARLTSQDLDIGGTTKHGDNGSLAGQHGEGLKIAALVLRREGFRVHLAASKYKFNFGFRGKGKSRMYCKLSPIPPATLTRKKANCRRLYTNGKPGGLASDPARDVSVFITKGRGATGVKVTLDKFQQWRRVALELDMPPSESIIQTEHGDLILDREKYHNPREFWYGYNLMAEEINRERQSLASPEEEALLVTKIWASAIENGGPSIVEKYTDLLNKHYDCADVSMADKKASKATALAIWARLVENGRGKFYYGLGLNETQDSKIITTSLRREPAGLSKKLWNLLSRYSLVRTPNEQRALLFENSQRSSLQPTQFSKHVQRGLAGCLALCSQTHNLSVEYVSGGDTDVAILFNPDTRCLKIHEKYLRPDTAHELAPCLAYTMGRANHEDSPSFFCDHIVEELY